MNAAVAEKALRSTTASASASGIVVQPTSVREIIQILNDPKRFPSPVRPRGSGSSITRCTAAIGGTVIDMTGMNRILAMGTDTVTVQPGIALSDLAEALREKGMELIGGFDLANRTAGGAVCGTGLEASMAGDVSQFAGHATQLKVISPTGKKFVVTEKTKSLLSMMRLSYGLLGIVYEITLRTRPIQSFGSQTARVSFKDFTEEVAPILGNAQAGLKLFLFPFTDRIFFELRKPTKETGGSDSDYSSTIRDWALYSALPVVAKSLARAVPFKVLRYPLLDNIGAATQSIMTEGRSRKSSNSIEQSARHRTRAAQAFTYCTWGFPVDSFATIAASYKLFCKTHYAKNGFRCDLPTIAYRMNRDRTALLSPSFDTALITLSPLSTPSEGLDDFMFEFAEFAMSLGGIPFLNQTKNATPQSVRDAYGKRLALFSRVRREFDPEDRLINQFFAAYFG